MMMMIMMMMMETHSTVHFSIRAHCHTLQQGILILRELPNQLLLYFYSYSLCDNTSILSVGIKHTATHRCFLLSTRLFSGWTRASILQLDAWGSPRIAVLLRCVYDRVLLLRWLTFHLWFKVWVSVYYLKYHDMTPLSGVWGDCSQLVIILLFHLSIFQLLFMWV